MHILAVALCAAVRHGEVRRSRKVKIQYSLHMPIINTYTVPCIFEPFHCKATLYLKGVYYPKEAPRLGELLIYPDQFETSLEKPASGTRSLTCPFHIA